MPALAGLYRSREMEVSVIKLSRSRGAADLHAEFTGEGLYNKLVALVSARLQYGQAMKFKGVIGDWAKTKEQLKKDSHDKCAYCECSTATVSYGDVEHFRPKSVYWWLALCVDNYVYSCQLCNQQYKKAVFGIAGASLPPPRLPATLPTDRQALKRLISRISPDPATVNESQLRRKWLAEDADLPHPYLEDPEPLFDWAEVHTNQEVLLVANSQASLRAQRAVNASINHLGLNRETLARRRYIFYQELNTFIAIWSSPIPPDLKSLVLKQIKNSCHDQHEFAGMCRYYARKANVPV